MPAAPSQPSHDGFRPDIEGLRGIAVLIVVLFHAGLAGVGGGFIGVDVFFVISGFLITGLLLREHERTGRIAFLPFYARRARRLLPAAIVVLLITLVASLNLVAPLDRSSVGLDGAAAALSIGNIRFALASGDYFASVTSPSKTHPTWGSLSGWLSIWRPPSPPRCESRPNLVACASVARFEAKPFSYCRLRKNALSAAETSRIGAPVLSEISDSHSACCFGGTTLPAKTARIQRLTSRAFEVAPPAACA